MEGVGLADLWAFLPNGVLQSPRWLQWKRQGKTETRQGRGGRGDRGGGQEWRAGEIEGEILEARESCRKGEAQRLSEDSAQIPG